MAKIELSNEKIKPLLDKLKLWCEKGQLEPRNYEVLSNMITKCENYDDAISILEIATQSRKTGLFYRHQFEKVPTNKIHFLEEDTKMSFGKKGTVNKLIIGDNYLALKNLLVTYRGKIDVIYIDPPYGCNDMGEFAETNYENNITRDNLLSQLSPRIELAHELLSNNGAIFVSMDDKNQAYVKCLMDDIFGENNFVCNLVWTNNEGGGGSDSKFFKIKHEYILCYSKNLNYFATKNVNIEDQDRYKLSDKHVKERGKYQLVKLSSASIQYSKSLDYPIKTPDGKFITPVENSDKERSCWRWSKTKLQWGLENDFVVFKKDKKGVWQVYTKQYINCDKDGNIVLRTKIPLALINKFSSSQASNALINLLGGKLFSYPKPVELIQFLIERIPNKDAIVLDFYAGSGTTGHAVLEQNKIDDGKRSFILCTNEDKGSNGQYPNGIGSDVTFERLKRVMTGKASDGSKFKWAEENEPYGQTLKVYRIAEVENTNKDVFKLIDPENYDYPCSTEKKKIEWICKNFEETQKILKEKK